MRLRKNNIRFWGPPMKISSKNLLLAVFISLMVIASSLMVLTAITLTTNEEVAFADPATYTGIGSGTANDPYLVYTADELRQLPALQAQDLNKAMYVQLMSDIDLQGDEDHQWTPFRFRGTFDGNGYTISGIYVNLPSISDVGGLFTDIKPVYQTPTRIKNLTVRGEVTGEHTVGGIVGKMNHYELYNSNDLQRSEISNCRSYVNVKGAYSVGGIAGSASSLCDIQWCSHEGSVTATGKNFDDNAYAGGIVGTTYSDVRYCYNDGVVEAKDSDGKYIGGIIGYSSSEDLYGKVYYGKPYACHNYGDVIGGTAHVGPIQGGRNGELIPSGTNYYRIGCGGTFTTDSYGITAEAFKQKSTFEPSNSWKFDDSNEDTGYGCWDMGEKYPVLKPFERLWVGGKNVNLSSYNTTTDINSGWEYYKATNTLVIHSSFETNKLDAIIYSELDDLNIEVKLYSYFHFYKESAEPVYGIYSKGNLHLAQRTYVDYDGDRHYGSIKVYGNATSTKMAKAPSCYGIYCEGDLTIDSGIFDISSSIATSVDGQSTGIYAKSVTINGGSVLATGYTDADVEHLGKSYGIVTQNGVRVNEGSYGLTGVGADRGIIGSVSTEITGSKYESYSSILSKIQTDVSSPRYDCAYRPSYLKDLTDSITVEIGNYGSMSEDVVVLAADGADFDAIANYTNKLRAIKNPYSITYPESKDTLDELEEIYNNLTPKQKSMISDDDLDYHQLLIDHYIADETVDSINEIDNVSLDKEDKDKIEKAKELYLNLTDNQKDLIPSNIDDTMKEIIEEFYDLIIDDITTKVNDISEVIYPDPNGKVNKAKDAYNDLTNDEKAVIPQDIKDKLDEAVRKYEKMEDDATRQKVEDKDTGVSIETDGSAGIPRYVELRVEIKSQVSTKEGIIDEAKVQQALGKNQRIVKVFSVKLIQTIDGVETEIQPSDIEEGMKIKVYLVVPNNMKTKGMSILHIHNDGTIDVINKVQVKDGVAIIEVASLSEFAFAENIKGGAHGFCVGWVVFIFVILEMLCACLYAVLRFGLIKDIIAKCKLDVLYGKMDLLTLIGLCVSGAIFLFALIALCVHQCAISIISFILAVIICGGFSFFFVQDRGIIKFIKQKEAEGPEEVNTEEQDGDMKDKPQE